MSRKTTSPWVYVGCGCLGAVVLAIGACLSLGLAGFQFARNFEEEMKDPVLRQERARELLGAEELPAGFHAQMHVSIPLFMDMVVLSDGRPIEIRDDGDTEIETDHLGDQAFIYLAMRDVGDVREDFESLLEGNSRELENVDVGLDFRSEEIVGRGEFDLPPQHVRYTTHRGEYRDGGERSAGTYSVLLIDCPGTSRVRAAFHWQRQATPEDPPLEAPAPDPGNPSTEAELKGFLGHFQLCG